MFLRLKTPGFTPGIKAVTAFWLLIFDAAVAVQAAKTQRIEA
jgi:hypothetical protein